MNTLTFNELQSEKEILEAFPIGWAKVDMPSSIWGSFL